MSLKEYTGQCMCGSVKYTVKLDLSQETGRCNCTTCWPLRFWYMRAKPADFHLLTSPDMITDYVHKEGSTHHQLFCKKCGIHTHHTIDKPQIGGLITSVNVACLDLGEEVLGVKIKYADGRNNQWWLEPKEKEYL
jgi:hypothetical protein